MIKSETEKEIVNHLKKDDVVVIEGEDTEKTSKNKNSFDLLFRVYHKLKWK